MDYTARDLFIYRMESDKTGDGVGLQGDYWIGYWPPGKDRKFIEGIPNARDVAGPYKSRQEAAMEMERLKGEVDERIISLRRRSLVVLVNKLKETPYPALFQLAWLVMVFDMANSRRLPRGIVNEWGKLVAEVEQGEIHARA